MKAAKATVTVIHGAQRVYSKKWSFLAAFLVILFLVIRICVVTGFVPDASDADASTTPATNTALENSALTADMPLTVTTTSGTESSDTAETAAPVSGTLNMNGELPTKVVISKIGVSTTVANPATTDVNTLDNYLSYGAARYPTSATLDQQGNVIIFGHSSYLPVVINQHYKTFDGIQNLKAGDLITVYSTQHVFTYAVTNVQQQNATTDAIALTTTGHTLTLATCDSFATKSDRFVVTATLVSSSPLGS